MRKTSDRSAKHNPGEILRWLTARQPAMVAQVRELVVRESSTNDKRACDALAKYLASRFEQLGGRAKLHLQKLAGNHLQVNFKSAKQGAPILLLGHFDTVYEIGTLSRMPWRQEKGRLFGPGVFDMKGGITQMLFALAALREVRGSLPRPVSVLLVSDEEEGSDSSRAITEKIARGCEAVLVCEPAGPGGAVKTARKGVGGFRITVTGKAAHSGLDFEKGHNAILELAHQIHAVSGLTDLQRGITLNVGVVSGGTRTNVVPSEAVAEVDLRITRKTDGAIMERKVRGLRPVNKNCTLLIEGGINRPPMERSKQVAALFHLAQEIAHQIGFPLHEIAVGGGSDGNFTAGLGIATLDGLGAVGEGAHAVHESIVAAELPRRAALLAGLIEAI